jgi:capsular exopolysaccharide synthesis family protein
VQAKQAQLDAITRQIEAAASNIRRAVRADYLAAQATEQQLKNRVEQLKSASLSEQDRKVQYGLLAREADTNREVYDGLLQRYKQLNAAAGISLSNVSVIDEADPPVSPSSPVLANNLLIGLVIGVFLAGVLVFLRHQFDDAIRVPEDIADKLGLPLLGVVPRVVNEEPSAALVDPKSDISEAYNSLRASLLYSTSEGLPQIMLFTSAQPSEGKTTSATATAASLAKLGKRTLLIDADLRRPSLHQVAGINNERGLSTLLTSTAELESLTAPGRVDGLFVLTSGPLPPSPTELISGPRMEQVLDLASRKFDAIVIDSPPILGLADAPILAAMADGVILIVEAERSRRGALRSAVRRLRGMRPILLGAVLTKFDAAKAGYDYAEYYGYGAHRYAA